MPSRSPGPCATGLCPSMRLAFPPNYSTRCGHMFLELWLPEPSLHASPRADPMAGLGHAPRPEQIAPRGTWALPLLTVLGPGVMLSSLPFASFTNLLFTTGPGYQVVSPTFVPWTLQLGCSYDPQSWLLLGIAGDCGKGHCWGPL